MAVDCVNARTVLWYITFFGFAINYMFRININIAIVAMVAPRSNKIGIQTSASECFEIANVSSNVPLRRNETTAEGFDEIDLQIEDRFQWDESEQGLVLGALYWLHWATQLPGGLLAQKYGAKKVFGLAQLTCCLLCFVIPPASYFSLKALLFVRVIQGLVAGLSWPSMHTLTGKWIPPNERSKFVTAYLGSSVGAAVTYPACGILIDWFGWESVFYTSGLLGVLWYMLWFFLVFDSPREHPRITDEERKYIEDSLGSSSKKQQLQTPWKAIFTSLPLWINACAQWGGAWGLYTILNQSPTYFKMIHGWDMQATGVFSGLPYLARITFAILFSHLGDFLLRRNLMSRTNVRKFATAVCTLGQGAMFIGLAAVRCDSVAAIILATATAGLHGAVSTGPLASLVDLSPNFAGVLFGICNTVSAIPGFVSPLVVGFLTLNNQTVSQWQIIFLIAGGMCVVCGLLHLIFSESELQSWNSPDTQEKGKTLQILSSADTSNVATAPQNKEWQLKELGKRKI